MRKVTHALLETGATRIGSRPGKDANLVVPSLPVTTAGVQHCDQNKRSGQTRWPREKRLAWTWNGKVLVQWIGKADEKEVVAGFPLDAPVMLSRTSGPRRKNPSPCHPACRLVQSLHMLLFCPFLWRRLVYSIGTFRKVIPAMVAQTMVRQLISVVNTSIWSVRWRTRLHRLSIALVVLM